MIFLDSQIVEKLIDSGGEGVLVFKGFESFALLSLNMLESPHLFHQGLILLLADPELFFHHGDPTVASGQVVLAFTIFREWTRDSRILEASALFRLRRLRPCPELKLYHLFTQTLNLIVFLIQQLVQFLVNLVLFA